MQFDSISISNSYENSTIIISCWTIFITASLHTTADHRAAVDSLPAKTDATCTANAPESISWVLDILDWELWLWRAWNDKGTLSWLHWSTWGRPTSCSQHSGATPLALIWMIWGSWSSPWEGSSRWHSAILAVEPGRRREVFLASH